MALAAFSRYGTGRGHPAQLNLGDCFAYAMAKNRRTALLFTGDDFSETDIAPASPAQPAEPSAPTSTGIQLALAEAKPTPI